MTVKMKTFRALALALFSLPACATWATQNVDGGGWISGGGDPLRFYFAEGKALALETLQELRVQNLSAKLPATTRTWITENRERMERDLAATELEWNVVSTQVTCALTEFRASAKISLSLEPCRRISSKEEAAKLLLHETTHHLGLRDEETADQIAIAIASAYEITKLKTVTLCKTSMHADVLKRLAGTWVMDKALTVRLGGAFKGLQRLSITVEPRLETLRELEGFGACALQTGVLILRGPTFEKRVRYAIAARDGDLLMIHPRLRGGTGPTEPARVKVRSLTFTRARSAPDDLLFLGDDDGGEASSAFRHE